MKQQKVSNQYKNVVHLCVTLDKRVFQTIEALRGKKPRSTFISQMLETVLFKEA